MRTQNSIHRQRSNGHRAFTLLEVLVALIALGVGLLGLAGSAAHVTRMVGDGSRRTLAATIATARLERLRALPCSAAVGGSGVTRGIEERWSVAPIGPSEPPRALEAQISVTYRVRAAPRSDTARIERLRGALPCR